jgi:type IV secretion system protein TrbG
MRLCFLALFFMLPGAVSAQVVPPIETMQAPAPGSAPNPGLPLATAPGSAGPAAMGQANGSFERNPVPINLLSGKDSALTASERQSLNVSKDWINAAEPPVRGEDGRVVYIYGSTLPSVVCAPLHVCDIALQAGEIINDLNAGDPVRWKISPASSGSGANKVTHVVVKPTDSALVTNLDIATDRRVYLIKLVSRVSEYMPLVGFTYPEDQRQQWTQYHQDEESRKQAEVPPSADSLTDLDFNFRVSGPNVAWKPVRVYTTGAKTYVEFPASIVHEDLPALVALGRGDVETLVNYRMTGDRFEVDKLLRHAALIRGVGHRQERIEITYGGKL